MSLEFWPPSSMNVLWSTTAPAHAAIGRDARLQGHESGGVSLNGRQILQQVAAHGVADGGVHRLQIGAGGSYLDRLRNRAQLHRDVQSKGGTDVDHLVCEFSRSKAGLGDSHAISGRG